MRKLSRDVVAYGVLIIVAVTAIFMATHHTEAYNCHKTAELVTECDFRYVGNK